MFWKRWRWVVPFIVGLALVASAPYLFAWAVTPTGAHFTGLLFNPQDGHSYIAKMRQGAEGSWLFRLPYTSEPQRGAPLFLFHLFLGHFARWFDLSLIAVYHGARLVEGALMVVAIAALVAELTCAVPERRAMLFLATYGSGLGWLASILGVMTADLWVSEAFPLYAALSNAHFALAIAMIVFIEVFGLRLLRADVDRGRTWVWGLALGCASALLGVVQPFGLVPAFGGLGVALFVRIVKRRAVPWRSVTWVLGTALTASIYPFYMQYAIHADPVLRVWGLQNVTLSPPLWDWVLSFGVLVPLCCIGVYTTLRRGSDVDWMIIGWLAVTLVGLYLPLPLQRRLSLGLGAPVGLLAGAGWWRGLRRRGSRQVSMAVRVAGVALCVLTPLFLILAAGVSIVTADARLYIGADEWKALAWLRDAGEPRVVLCSPQTGLLVPAWSGQPVVYGHPFETVEAEQRRADVEAYWSGEMGTLQRESFLRDHRVGYLFVGPREQALGGVSPSSLDEWMPVFHSGAVTIYEAESRQQ